MSGSQEGPPQKIHEAITKVITPLLNLNLNYEKLRCEDSDFFPSCNIHDTNFCIFEEQYLLPVLIK